MKNSLENEVNKKNDKSYNTTTGFELMTYAMKPEHLPTGLSRHSVIAV